MKSPLVALGLLVFGCCFLVFADDVGSGRGAFADKSGYWLFKPAPDNALRPVRMQAYDNVADPTTVDAGHFQVEGSLFNFYRVERHYTPPWGPYNFAESLYSWTPRFTAGLLNNLDLEVVPTYAVLSERVWGEFRNLLLVPGPPPGPFHGGGHASGFGPVIVESKLNLWGNDSGMTAMSVSPILSIPTSDGYTTLGSINPDIAFPFSDGNVLVGLDAAFALRLPEGFYLKLESQVMQQRFRGRDGWKDYVGFFEGFSVNKSFGSKWDAYTAVTAEVSSYSFNPWWGYAGFGAIYKVTRDFQVFGGLNFGLSDNSFDYNPRFGIVWRR